METLVTAGLWMIGAGSLTWFIAQGICSPIEPDKCRIITRLGKATGAVRGPGVTWIPLKGMWYDFVVLPRIFEIPIKVEFALPDETYPTIAEDVVALVRVADDGGAKLLINGGQEGVTKKVSRIAATEIEEFAADPGEEPKNLDQAKRMKPTFVYRAVKELVDDGVLDALDALPDTEKAKALKKLEADLSDDGESFSMSVFGLELIGFSMGRLVEPPAITEIAMKKKVATEENQIKQEQAVALNERLKTVAEGMPGASLSDISKVMFTADGTVKPIVHETVVRIERPATADGGHLMDDILAGWVAANASKTGGKDGGKGKS
ncbi:MAG: hypothetical protein UW32_C0002G0005 [Candidatus Wolfebacteria bacterium GW2011_GWE2_44_13]|uniref:Band 7 domain-containing protein n=1 Tax=Candidatus Wolfebacteria bacterium GW2011_GWE2_44_13 TaxID=1619017 RepID=A0A0G1K5R1_9BACT|nr:MAG: hypothetical protein UW32_C0002G0005 [Candidatus Wolfebacteria bacterium GW2011_GWE2_44_13]